MMMEGSQGPTTEVEVHEVVVEPTELRESGVGEQLHHRAVSLGSSVEQLEDEVRLEEARRNVVTWRLCDWNMVIDDMDQESQQIVVQILSSPLCPEAILAIGVVLFGIWQGADPYNILLMDLTCVAFYFAAIFFGLQRIILTKLNPHGNHLLSSPQGCFV